MKTILHNFLPSSFHYYRKEQNFLGRKTFRHRWAWIWKNQII